MLPESFVDCHASLLRGGGFYLDAKETLDANGIGNEIWR
jgi:hypothetical protein